MIPKQITDKIKAEADKLYPYNPHEGGIANQDRANQNSAYIAGLTNGYKILMRFADAIMMRDILFDFLKSKE